MNLIKSMITWLTRKSHWPEKETTVSVLFTRDLYVIYMCIYFYICAAVRHSGGGRGLHQRRVRCQAAALYKKRGVADSSCVRHLLCLRNSSYYKGTVRRSRGIFWYLVDYRRQQLHHCWELFFVHSLSLFLLTTQGGIYVFQLMDHYTAVVSLMCLAFFEVMAVCWIFGMLKVPHFNPNVFFKCEMILNILISCGWFFINCICFLNKFKMFNVVISVLC